MFISTRLIQRQDLAIELVIFFEANPRSETYLLIRGEDFTTTRIMVSVATYSHILHIE